MKIIMRLINCVCMSMTALAMLLSCDNYKPDSEEPPVDVEPKISVSPTAPDAIAAAGAAVNVSLFKAILRYKKGSQDAVWAGAGFYTEHRSYESPALVPISMSIDELEEKTGLDFFVNLPAMIGEEEAQKIESATDSWWQ